MESHLIKTLYNDFNPVHCYVKQHWDYWQFTCAEGGARAESERWQKNPDIYVDI